MDQIEKEQLHPRVNLSKVKLLKEVGEIEYMRNAKQEALEWIKADPGQFAWLSIQRFFNLWFGPPYRLKTAATVSILTALAVTGFLSQIPSLSPPQRAVLLIPLLTYPLIYYFMTYMPRYRVPIDWLIYILAGSGFISLLQLIFIRNGSVLKLPRSSSKK